MKIELRNRKLPSGNKSLYLEFYEKGGKRTYESLNLFLIPENDENDRRVNENTLSHALKIKAERILGIERVPEDVGINAIPSHIFSEWMNEFEVYIRDSKKLSPAYCKHVHSTINIVKKKLNPDISIGGVVLTMFNLRTQLSRQVKEETDKYFGGKVFKTVIPRNVRLAEAPSHGLAICDYDKNSKGARAYESLAKEVIKRA